MKPPISAAISTSSSSPPSFSSSCRFSNSSPVSSGMTFVPGLLKRQYTYQRQHLGNPGGTCCVQDTRHKRTMAACETTICMYLQLMQFIDVLIQQILITCHIMHTKLQPGNTTCIQLEKTMLIYTNTKKHKQ